MAKKAAHHGGAWKVAFADFMTALMALFMVLWISGQNVEIRQATSKFFQDPYNALPEHSSGLMAAHIAGARNEESHTDPTAPANMGFLQAIAKELYRLVNVEEKQDDKPIDIQVTSDGLRINLYNRAAKPVFVKDSSEFTEWGNFVVQTVAWLIDRYDFKVFIDGHTPAGREPLRKDYGSWELSADRANSSRRALQHYAVDARLIERVAGFGDTVPLPNTAPEADSNERITISLSAQQQSRKQIAEVQAFQIKKAESVTTQ
ncbi:MAG: chemotaxis protein MotB [Chthoniobacter sp.]|jgi:chemotaxis protein MotB|nr:chemotaxis protein MotB [Chthoniobacter sp.]